MSLLPDDNLVPHPALKAGRDDALLRRMECRACPLSDIKNNHNPKMEPTGAKKPTIYMLGDAPSRADDDEGEPFRGDVGAFLRPLVPKNFKRRVRWNNCVRTRPLRNRAPGPTELTCCRPSIERDIAEAKPVAIFGFDNVTLNWAIGMNGITVWRGRRIPVTIGGHTCWFYPFQQPSWLIKQRRQGKPSEAERMFELDLDRAFGEVESLPAPVVHTATDARANTDIITEGGAKGIKRVHDLLAWAAEQPGVGVDYETNCIRPYEDNAQILTAAVGTEERAEAFPFDHRDAQWTDGEYQTLIDLWCDFLSAPKVRRYSHNLMFELEWTGEMFGREYVRAGEWEDSMTQAAILDERRGGTKPGPQSLDFLIMQYFGFNLKALSALDRKRLAEMPMEAVLSYNAMDAKYHKLLFDQQDARVRLEGLEECYVLGRRRVPTVVLSQLSGAPVNQDEVSRLQVKYGDRIDGIMEQIEAQPGVAEFRKRRGEDFNPMSNPDALVMFRDLMKRSECEVIDKYTKETKYSVDENTLAKIDHPLAKLIVGLRKANKRKSTYIDPLHTSSPLLYSDGCIHYQLNTTFAATGRLSAQDPNVQNFPKRDDEAVEVRRQIQAPPGCRILSVDYGQIEARVIAMFTKDKTFCKALWERYDIHLDWAERIAYEYPRRVGGKKMLKDKKAMKDFRTDIKNQWTFPLIFGARTKSVAEYLKMPLDVVEEMVEQWWDEMSGIRDWQAEQLKLYEERGYVECLTGRRRRGPMTTNMVFNSPIQGTAAEIVMDGMARLSETLDPELQPELNIHDDLTWLRVPENRVEDVAEKILDCMLSVPFEWVNVPITVEMEEGVNWMPYDKTMNPDGMQAVDDFSSDEWFK